MKFLVVMLSVLLACCSASKPPVKVEAAKQTSFQKDHRKAVDCTRDEVQPVAITLFPIIIPLLGSNLKGWPQVVEAMVINFGDGAICSLAILAYGPEPSATQRNADFLIMYLAARRNATLYLEHKFPALRIRAVD